MAVPSGLYAGVAQVEEENTQFGATQLVQLAPPSEVETLLFAADQIAS